MFPTQEKAKTDTKNVKVLNLPAIDLITVKVTELPSEHKLSKVVHNFLHQAEPEEDLCVCLSIKALY
jgi:hypothetical protein